MFAHRPITEARLYFAAARCGEVHLSAERGSRWAGESPRAGAGDVVPAPGCPISRTRRARRVGERHAETCEQAENSRLQIPGPAQKATSRFAVSNPELEDAA